MDVAVLLLLALFFTALAVRTTSRYDVLRGSAGQPRLLLMNVAAACGVAALHGSLRGRALAGPGAAAAVAGSAPPTGTAAGDGQSIRMGVLGWTGPLIALIVVTAVVALGSGGDGTGSGGNGTGAGRVGPTTGSVGSALAICSLLVCVISAASLFRRPVRASGRG